ncbi:hypothetical protein DIPPA_10975 [Diplonema papillatum]|nr:hypothetical protein DIPPA_10975 [Diplonema papillatum]
MPPPMQFSTGLGGSPPRGGMMYQPRPTGQAGPGVAGDPFRSQLHRLNDDIEGFAKKLSNGTPVPSELAHLGYRNPQQLQSQVGGLYKAIEQVNGHLQRDDIEKRQLLDDMDRMKIQMSIKQSEAHQKRFAAGDPLAAQQQQQQQLQHLLDQQQRILEHQAQQQPGGVGGATQRASASPAPAEPQGLHNRAQLQHLSQQLNPMLATLSGAPGGGAPASGAGHQDAAALGRHEAEIRDKNEQIASLREEKAVMKEWLDRGVNECRRVAEEVQRLRLELDQNDGEKDRMGAEKKKLEKMLEQVMGEVRHATEKLKEEKSEREAAILGSSLKEQAMSAQAEQMQRAHDENNRLSSEVARLMERVKDAEDGEMHLRAFVAGLSRVSSGFISLHAAVENDRLGDLAGVGYNAEATHSTAGEGPVDSVVANGKKSLTELQDVLLALRSVVRARIEDTQVRAVEMAQKESDLAQRAVEGARKAEQDLRERHSVEKRILEGKLEELEAELSALSDSNLRSQQQLTAAETERAALRSKVDTLNTSEDYTLPTRPAANANLLSPTKETNPDVLSARVFSYESRCLKLEQQNGKLKEKNKKMKVDWSKVTELRQYCQKLEIEKKSMLDYIEKMESENDVLKRRSFNVPLYTGDPTAPGRVLSPSKRHETDQASVAWKEWQRSHAGSSANPPPWNASSVMGKPSPSVRFSSPHARHPTFPGPSLPLPSVPRPSGQGPWMPSP